MATNDQLTASHHEAAASIASRLEAAWNEADAAAFASAFTPDADFVNVRGDYASGRDAIAAGHTHIWKTIYAGSIIRYTVARVRELAPGVLIGHLDARLHVPSGPLAGDMRALPSVVLVYSAGAWQIAAFQNTPISAR